AGAGGVGLEALSRGAAHATFVERDARAVTALRDNIKALEVGPLVAVRRGDVLRELPALLAGGERFDIVFLDPPYEAGLVETTLEMLGGGGLTLPDAQVIAQHFTKTPPAAVVGRLGSFRTRRFGETTLTFYRAGWRGRSPCLRGRPAATMRRSTAERRSRAVAKRAVYPGMFDPIHNGHVDVIHRSLAIFDEVIVAVVANPSKQPLFTMAERLEMIDE